MNHWTQLSIEYANQRNYLDHLFRVYPTIPDGIRDIDENRWEAVTDAFNAMDNISLVTHLLYLDLFPINNPDASVGVCCSHKVVAVGFNTLCYDASVGVLNPPHE